MVAIHRKAKEEIESRKANYKFRVQADFNVDPRPTILTKITGVSEKSNIPAGPKDNYSMLVVGTRGMSNIESMMMGSVSIFLLNHSPIPVVVVRSTGPKKQNSGRRLNSGTYKLASTSSDAPIVMSSLDGGGSSWR